MERAIVRHWSEDNGALLPVAEVAPAQAVVSGLMEVQLKTEVPVFSVSLTPHHFQPKGEHHDFFHAHFVQKGREAADAAMQIFALQYWGMEEVHETAA